jgi:hypothetical protein
MYKPDSYSSGTYVRPSSGAVPNRALSIRQPWTWAILYAGKRVENRSWYTDYRGPIYLHSGREVEYDALECLRPEIEAIERPRPPAVCGALLATAILADCVRPNDVPDDQLRWVAGPWCFLLRDVRLLARPIPWRGNLGLFVVSSDSP